MQAVPEVFRLHIGGEEVKPGWKIFNIQPKDGVDYVGDIEDLSRFADECCDEIYASHVLEHVPLFRVLPTLKGFHRILKQGGRVMISVPDLELLCQLFTSAELDKHQRFHVMKMIYGAQVDETDYHHIGFSPELMREYLSQAGFSRHEQVDSFGLFNDGSDFAPYGGPISLNVVAYK